MPELKQDDGYTRRISPAGSPWDGGSIPPGSTIVKECMVQKEAFPWKEYHGQVVRASASIQKIEFGWYYQDIPDDAKAFGLTWTACADITPKQAQMIGKCGVLVVSDEKGVDWIRIPLAHIPCVMHKGEYVNIALPGKPMPFGPRWVGVVQFIDCSGDTENGVKGIRWSTFPGKTWIRIDVIDKR